MSKSLRVQPWFHKTRSIYAIGRNYHAHIKELDNPTPDAPFWFMKPYSSLLYCGKESQNSNIESGATNSTSLPIHKTFPGRKQTHHELELGLIMKKDLLNQNSDGSKSISNVPQEILGDQPNFAMENEFLNEYVAGFFLALDMTDRQGQSIVKEKRLPWTQVKGWETSCPVGNIKSYQDFNFSGQRTSNLMSWRDLRLWLKVNGENNPRQHGSCSLMIHSIPDIMKAVSRVHALQENDMILTGTPEGVGLVEDGDVVTAGIDGFDELDLEFVVRENDDVG